MAAQRFRWMDWDSGDAKTSRWNTAASGAPPREAWYYGSRFGRVELTPEFLETLRRTFWSDVDAKYDETLAIDGVPLLRVTLPRKFVPHFDAEFTGFFLYKAASSLTVVDFGKLWGGPIAEAPRHETSVEAAPDADLPPDPTDTPAPGALLRAEPPSDDLSQDPVTVEVEPLPPKITERVRAVVPSPRDVDLPEDRAPAPIWVSDVPVTVTPAQPPPLQVALTLPPKRPAEPPKPTGRSGGSGWMGAVLACLLVFLALFLFWAFHLFPTSR